MCTAPFSLSLPIDCQRHWLAGGLRDHPSYGLQNLAEGVETAQQWHLLRDLGCDFYQGYRFDRGLDAEAFAAGWLR